MIDSTMTKNITLSADEKLIQLARIKAQTRQTTLNSEFRRWLQQYVEQDQEAMSRLKRHRRLMNRLSKVDPGRRFSRDEMNER